MELTNYISCNATQYQQWKGTTITMIIINLIKIIMIIIIILIIIIIIMIIIIWLVRRGSIQHAVPLRVLSCVELCCVVLQQTEVTSS